MSFRTARVRAGLKVTDVMKALNVSDGAVYLWETGVTRPRAGNLLKLAELYGCMVDELLRADDGQGGDIVTEAQQGAGVLPAAQTAEEGVAL